MITADVQLKNGVLVPFSMESKTLLRKFKPNQILKARVSGIQKEQSVPQFRLFHACMRTVADNTEDPQWNDLEKVKIQLKHILHYYKTTVVLSDGSIHFELDTFAFENFRRWYNDRVFDRSIPILAKKIGVSPDDLLRNAEQYG